MSLKHVAIIVKYFPTVSETFIVNQINSLIDTGCHVTLFAYNQIDIPIKHESLLKHDLLNKVQYFVKPPINKLQRLFVFFKWISQHFIKIKWQLFFKCLNVFKYGKDAYTLKLFFEAQWFLVPYKFDLIHTHFGMNGNRIAYLKACKIIPNQVKLINTFHGYDLAPNILNTYKEAYKYLCKEANAFTVNTPYLEGLLAQVNSYKKPCYILPVGLDTRFFKKMQVKTNQLYFNMVFCGKLIALKGPDLALKIIKRLHKLGYTQVRLHIIGDGILKDQLLKKVKSSKIENSVFFHGNISQKAIIQHFEEADVFMLPGRYDPDTGRAETQGLVIQEAQAMELPVIVSDVGGMKYGVLANESGFVVEEENLEDFVSAVEQLILDSNLKTRMGKAGRKNVELTYDNTILIKKLQEIYKDVVIR